MTLEEFRARFTEFEGVADSLVSVYLTEAEADLHPTLFGDNLQRLVGLLTAHRLTQSVDADGTPSTDHPGFATRMEVDQVSVSYARPPNMSARDLSFASTAYGINFLELRNRYVKGPRVGGC